MLISVIISTYNRPKALELILKSFNYQTDKDFEVIVADDGSTSDTRHMVKRMMMDSNFPITYVTQEDKGFRLARIRNLAATKAQGDYLVFLDGDCVPRKNFIQMHRMLAQKNTIVAGNRILLSEDFTKEIEGQFKDICTYSFIKWFSLYLKGSIKRLHPLITIPFNFGRNLGSKWKKVRGCNFALYKEDYIKVNGCDSDFEGWGYEDSDLAIRLIHAGLSVKSGRFATATFHLFHQENDRSKEQDNLKRLQERIKSSIIEAQNGIKQLNIE
ncbi:MAG: glycosyltransferase family 2 protein [Succinivibrio sp.]|nr:glycosyltransferase family 2 protein [Succinivibrio sp.]